MSTRATGGAKSKAAPKKKVAKPRKREAADADVEVAAPVRATAPASKKAKAKAPPASKKAKAKPAALDDGDIEAAPAKAPASKKTKAKAAPAKRAAPDKDKADDGDIEAAPTTAPASKKAKAKAPPTSKKAKAKAPPASKKAKAKAAALDKAADGDMEAAPAKEATAKASIVVDEPVKEAASLSKTKSVVSSRGSAPKGAIEVVLSFDTTGSMYACLGVVRQSLSQLATELFNQFPAIRIGVIAHGDYCDADSTYVKKVLPFSNDVKQIVDWISNVGSSGGGDFPEAYELSLRTARTEFSWSAGSRKSLVLVGDAPPHEADYPLNKDKIDWLSEAKKLGEDGVVIYAIQALNYSQSNHFYSTIASVTGGIRLSLDQFAESPDFVRAICYREVLTLTLTLTHPHSPPHPHTLTHAQNTRFAHATDHDPIAGRPRASAGI
jgi:hypothetical protein